MAITKYARTVHTGSDPQRQPGQPKAAHGSPPHPAVMNPCFSTTDYLFLAFESAKDARDKDGNVSNNIFISLCEK